MDIGWGGVQKGETPSVVWFLSREGAQHGPISDMEFQELLARKMLRPTDHVWREGFEAWRTVASLQTPSQPAPGSIPAPYQQVAAQPAQRPLRPSPVPVREAARETYIPPEASRAGYAIEVPAARSPTPPRAAAAVATLPGSIFLSYRRDDSAPWAGRIYERLSQDIDRRLIFMDVDNIPPGHDFVEVLDERVAGCEVFLCVIGPRWSEARNPEGRRRIDDPNDFVRIEVESALAHGKRVIPLLVDGAQMPLAQSLPESLRPLVRRNAVELTHARFGRDIATLLEALPKAAPLRADPPPAVPLVAERPEPAVEREAPMAVRRSEGPGAGRAFGEIILAILLGAGGYVAWIAQQSRRPQDAGVVILFIVAVSGILAFIRGFRSMGPIVTTALYVALLAGIGIFGRHGWPMSSSSANAVLSALAVALIVFVLAMTMLLARRSMPGPAVVVWLLAVAVAVTPIVGIGGLGLQVAGLVAIGLIALALGLHVRHLRRQIPRP